MDPLLEAAKEYSKLFNKDYIYTLETGTTLQVYFQPSFFHHLMGLHKLKDVDLVIKSPRNSPTYIYGNIISGLITMDDILKSEYFNEIESRLRHFSQINRMIEFERIVIDFDPAPIKSKMTKADWILFKRSNDNMYLNLFLMTDDANPYKQIPLTFLPNKSDYYTYGQRIIKIVSMTEAIRAKKRNR